MTIDLENAIANDEVGKKFAANYISGIKRDKYDAAKKVMTWHLQEAERLENGR